MKAIIGIYKITSPSGKIYIGQSIDINRRRRGYEINPDPTQCRLYNSIKKYGWKKHRFRIMRKCKKNQLNRFEKHYIELYKSFNTKNGLNLKEGGHVRCKLSDETLRKKSIAMSGINNHFYGKPAWNKGRPRTRQEKNKISKGLIKAYKKIKKVVSEETKRKMSLSKIGIPINVGVKFKKKHKMRLSRAIRKSWIKRKQKYGHRAHPNMILGRIKKLSTPVAQFNEAGECIKIWNSIRNAQRTLNIHSINSGIKRNKKRGNYIWKKI